MCCPRFYTRVAMTATCALTFMGLTACGGNSGTGLFDVANQAPIASAGADLSAETGSVVTLNASASSDPDGDALTYTWQLTTPSGSSASLSSASVASPTFTPDVWGVYTAMVTVSDGALSASDDTEVVAFDSYCSATVDAFPLPLNQSTSIFDDTDDGSARVSFASGFQFSFYGVTYDEVYLNTNGGMTFGAGFAEFEPGAADVGIPGIGVFWADLLAVEDRPRQMYYEACPDRFLVYYRDFHDWDVADWTNTATLTLFADGTVEVQYETVDTEDVLVGVFDGTHSNDQYVAVQASYTDYLSWTGTILFDAWGAGPGHDNNQLSDQTITFHPGSPLLANGEPSSADSETPRRSRVDKSKQH